MPEAASKIIKPDGKPVTDLERQISGALADLDSSSEIKNQLRELFIVGVKVSIMFERNCFFRTILCLFKLYKYLYFV